MSTDRTTEVTATIIERFVGGKVFVERGSCTDVDTCRTPGVWHINRNTQNSPAVWGIMVVFQAGDILGQLILPLDTKITLYVRTINGNKAYPPFNKIIAEV